MNVTIRAPSDNLAQNLRMLRFAQSRNVELSSITDTMLNLPIMNLDADLYDAKEVEENAEDNDALIRSPIPQSIDPLIWHLLQHRIDHLHSSSERLCEIVNVLSCSQIYELAKHSRGEVLQRMLFGMLVLKFNVEALRIRMGSTKFDAGIFLESGPAEVAMHLISVARQMELEQARLALRRIQQEHQEFMDRVLGRDIVMLVELELTSPLAEIEDDGQRAQRLREYSAHMACAGAALDSTGEASMDLSVKERINLLRSNGAYAILAAIMIEAFEDPEEFADEQNMMYLNALRIMFGGTLPIGEPGEIIDLSDD
jgi:hypothetical protein